MTPFEMAWTLLKQFSWYNENPITHLTSKFTNCPQCGQGPLIKYKLDNKIVCQNCGYDSAKALENTANQHPLQNNPFWIGNNKEVA